MHCKGHEHAAFWTHAQESRASPERSPLSRSHSVGCPQGRVKAPRLCDTVQDERELKECCSARILMAIIWLAMLCNAVSAPLKRMSLVLLGNMHEASMVRLSSILLGSTSLSAKFSTQGQSVELRMPSSL